jgi:hypothetical protein
VRYLTAYGLDALNLLMRLLTRAVLGPDLGDACRGRHDDESGAYSYRDTSGVLRCSTCAMRLEP